MTTAFVGLLLGVLAVAFVGIMSARAAKKHEREVLKQSRVIATGVRTLDHAAKIPSQEPDRNKPSNAAVSALAGTGGQSPPR